MDFLVIAILIAALLDILLGDPRWMPHPIRWIGKSIEFSEFILKRLLGPTKLGGIVLTTVIVGGTYGIAFGLVWIAFNLHILAGIIVSAAILYTCFATQDLDKQSRKVYSKIKKGNLDQAQIQLSMIVGRDTTNLTEEEMTRATIETVAENTVDGVLSPLFYAVIGGAPLALAFKAVSTLDSMVGYKNEQYKDFGWASAKLDDLLNFIPARLARFLYPIAALLCKLNSLNCWKIAWRDGNKSPSPNAGISEAAFAGALQVQLGGENNYQGQTEMRPLLGDPIQSLTSEKIPQAINLMYFTTAVTVIFLVLLRLTVRFILE